MTILIIGGGLSGLALAEQFETRGQDYLLLEARARLGGRILTEQVGAAAFDMGPAWFWPGQPRIDALIRRLGLTPFDQFSRGAQRYENEHGQVQSNHGFASMQGALRLEGGMTTLTQALARQLPARRIRLNAQVTQVQQSHDGCAATLSTGETVQARQVVLAMPPRIAAQITFSPALPDTTLHAMRHVATWMAGQAKAIAIYDTPFWREDGLSGDATSRHGPMVEIHDASPCQDGPYALFGFVGIPPQHRTDEHALRHHLQAQLVRLFGDKAATPRQLLIKDWARDPFTSTEADKAPLYAHPSYGLPQAMTGLWNDKLLFAGSEVAAEFGGYIEGALEAAAHVLGKLETPQGAP
ncbi:MAG: flavin monoamine oxidase family protein [Roseovarius sp.]